jgi:hypothetical protein
MREQILGTRNGQSWPPPGGEIDLPEGEASKLVASGRATLAGKRKREASR